MPTTTGPALYQIHRWLLTGDEVAAMRHWLGDCVAGWRDLDLDDVAELTPEEVVAGVQRHYDGGVRGFLQELDI